MAAYGRPWPPRGQLLRRQPLGLEAGLRTSHTAAALHLDEVNELQTGLEWVRFPTSRNGVVGPFARARGAARQGSRQLRDESKKEMEKTTNYLQVEIARRSRRRGAGGKGSSRRPSRQFGPAISLSSTARRGGAGIKHSHSTSLTRREGTGHHRPLGPPARQSQAEQAEAEDGSGEFGGSAAADASAGGGKPRWTR